MHIAIDAHSVGTGLGGNESYATHLIEALAEIDGVNSYTLYVTRREAVERFTNRWPNFQVRATLPHTPFIRIPLTLGAELRKNPVDVLHVQFTAPPLAPCPVVVSIHDLSFEHLPETFKWRSRTQLRLTVRRSARQAAQVLALSEYARSDIINTYGISPDKVTAIPLAAPAHFAPVTDDREFQRVRQTYGIQSDYILSVGSIQPRKNLNRLIAAYSSLRRARPEGKLPQIVLVGKCAWLYDETLRTIKELGLSNSVVLTGYVPETDLPALYSGALCFVYPSYFEGFGLPPLEAMKCGTPVIVGNKTSLPEVVGEAGVLVDPFDVDDIASAIASVIGDSNFRSQLRAKGLERSRLFDWRETARQTLAIYRKAAGVD
ncbi:MAG TPA: glycosyltransferase family 1 protein [Blastocatellia bacterium]|nr:glycosyltransferase family 1 protein [Blastocatellia bacterium]HCX31920.1 glycosyltransferase family 1 protein [Blastocatellia bacterium]